METFTVYDEKNRLQGTFSAGELAQWKNFPAEWCIEWFTDTISRGLVSFDEVKSYANGGSLVTPKA